MPGFAITNEAEIVAKNIHSEARLLFPNGAALS
jgi:hypothetical protein